ncbi:MAG: hypothetical protein KKD11_04090 [Candidatus Omnitrophica bacterium]|nr:hypothetical protein [Candidatus Omnitrophota bacterium]
MKNITALFKNDITKKILLFFDENPQCIDTAKGISVWIGCDPDKVQKVLKKLDKEKILISHKTASTQAYSYTNQKDILKKIEKYIKTYERKISR